MSDRLPTAPPPAPPRPPAPQRARPDAEHLRRAGRLSGHFGLITLAAVLAASLPLPWGLAALGFTLAAAVVGVLALVATVRAGMRWPGVVVVSVGLGLVALLLLIQLLQVAFYPAVRADQDCIGAAITERAVAQCADQRQQRAFDQLFGR